MTTRIKFPTFKKTGFSDIEKFWLNFFIVANLVEKGFAKLNHVLTVGFFDGKVRKDLLAKIKQFISSNTPGINITLILFAWSNSCCCAMSSFKCIYKPINEFLLGIINLKDSAMIEASTGFCLDFINTKAAFSINNSCKISQINWVIRLWNIIFRSSIVLFTHINSFIVNGAVVNDFTYNYTGINDECKAYAERLNEWTSEIGVPITGCRLDAIV